MSFTAMSTINNLEVKSLVNGKTFNDVVKECDQFGIDVRTKNDNSNISDLFLLVSKDDDTPLKMQCNGIILQKETNNVVCACQNKFVSVSKEEMRKTLVQNGEGDIPFLRVEYCEDGTVMRLYNYKNTWYTATTKCIDARESYWSSNKTFDEMFWETFDKSYLDHLDKNSTYVFVLLHSENRIVVKHARNSFVYISRINNETMEEDYRNVFRFAWRPRMIPYFDLDDINRFYWPQKRGVLIKVLQQKQTVEDVQGLSQWKMYKVDFDQYIHIKDVRGNVPNIYVRYLELLGNEDMQRDLEKYYYEYRNSFDQIRKDIYTLVKTIHKLYVDSHIKRTTQITEEHIFWRTLRQLHAQYKATNKPICYEDVHSKLKSLDRCVLKKFLGWV